MDTTLTTAACLSYTANAALGAGVAGGVIDTGHARWVHHALYISTLALTSLAVVSGIRHRRIAAWLLMPALLPLAALPRTRGRGREHPLIALTAAPAYVSAVIATVRRAA
ncbi:hypothetical protein OH146_10515 [Salinibacterium sp. SYSU T00001]|uniref:hypothetical protein n=1 Tax=Homoserinimonas sedimenticola TaxID=2986805 RepID=UPI002236BD92|nr:hypothetical protein [Salinibacterium sedimenticola]MCW4386203.1 hypothetical protein [Salinibacterium sedimenticola]